MPPSAAERLVSLDAFRGFAIAGMVLVNNAGDWEHVYRQLEHAEWNGWTFADWVFPFFLFICGVALLACLGLGAMLDVVLMPINKNLWTTSYCIFMTGWALLLFAAFFWLIDGSGSPALRDSSRRLLQPFTIYGMNALFIFALSGLVARLLLVVKFAREGGGAVSLKALLYAPIEALPIAPVDASLLYAILFNAAMFAVAWWMWKKRWFVKV